MTTSNITARFYSTCFHGCCWFDYCSSCIRALVHSALADGKYRLRLVSLVIVVGLLDIFCGIYGGPFHSALRKFIFHNLAHNVDGLLVLVPGHFLFRRLPVADILAGLYSLGTPGGDCFGVGVLWLTLAASSFMSMVARIETAGPSGGSLSKVAAVDFSTAISY